ncbi:hypothetical protein IFR04_008009 [Cadophora malorum]|uniref:2EXR domain-containing protein n=1 Tax=Cadophora malorum TaxID=108018 RepID=A0A8H7W6F8_9HELO|nr:hypothetical protein IFR04_008009 [Cadophora malorum]
MSTTISSQPATNLGYFEPLPFDFIDLATINLSFFEALPFYQTLDSFELFPKLPGELQVMIWQAAAADLPVRTCSIRQSPGQARPNIANPKYSIGFQERLTEILQERYKLFFGGIDDRPVWFDFKKDVLDVQWKFLIELKGGSSTFNHVITDEKSLRADCAQVEWLDEYLLALRYRECPSSACRFRPFRSLEKITEISLKEYHNNAYSHKRARYLEIHLLTWKDLMNEWHNTHD